MQLIFEEEGHDDAGIISLWGASFPLWCAVSVEVSHRRAQRLVDHGVGPARAHLEQTSRPCLTRVEAWMHRPRIGDAHAELLGIEITLF